MFASGGIMDRREFLAATSTLAVAGCLPHRPLATLDESADEAAIVAHVAAIRVGMDRALARFESWLDRFPDRPQGPVVAAYRQAVPALHGYGALGGMPVETQVHPVAQALVNEVLDALLPAVRTLRGWFGKMGRERLAALDAKVREDPELLDDVVGLLGAEVGQEVPHDDARNRVNRLLDRVRWQVSRRGFARVIPDATDQYDRTARATATSAAPAELEARAERACRRWGDPTYETCGDRRKTGGVVVGVFGVLITLGGAILLIAGGASIVANPDCICVGLFLLMVGLAVLIVGLAMVLVGFGMQQPRRGNGRPDTPEPTAQDALPPPPDAVPIAAGAGWVTTPFVISAGTRWLISAVGVVDMGSETVSPEGGSSLAEAGAPLPGMPRGMLVGRVGQALFAVKRVATTPEGATGPLELAVNLAPYEMAGVTGAFSVTAVELQHAAATPETPAPSP
jgi:hypothetical protein